MPGHRPFVFLVVTFTTTLLLLTSPISAQSCPAGQDCSFVGSGICTDGNICSFLCTSATPCSYVVCGTGPCNVTCVGQDACALTSIYATTGPVTLTCGDASGLACEYAQIYTGSAQFDLICKGIGGCESSTVHGGTGPINVWCSDSEGPGTVACDSLIVRGGGGPTNILCDGENVCMFATFNPGPGNSVVTCRGQNACYYATVNAETGIMNLTCDKVASGDSALGIRVNQKDAIITESNPTGNVPHFYCKPGQWQCFPNATYCVSAPCQCPQLNNCPPPTSCPPEGDYGHAHWPETGLGARATGTCNPGYGQSGRTAPPTRYCNPNGVWDHRLSYNCARLYCPAFNDETTSTSWPVTTAGLKRLGTCTSPGVHLHPPQRICNSDGTWGAFVYNPC